jgi:hypothetical protein
VRPSAFAQLGARPCPLAVPLQAERRQRGRTAPRPSRLRDSIRPASRTRY